MNIVLNYNKQSLIDQEINTKPSGKPIKQKDKEKINWLILELVLHKFSNLFR